ncbi:MULTISPECIES: hypothetical protein [Pedobacter]|uniref:hypothetical protein n=1 Tax=Pedobacter TaxID=84567 RepID=UPI00064B4EE6|nr:MULTISPECIES: hypothetical protein [Pedobacter]KLT63887.1 hypothetical protein AB669_19340 [Pedobacter sp. BMA]
MNIKAATEKREIKIGSDLISIEPVKGDKTLFRISIHQTFKGYIIKQDGQYSKTAGSDIHDLIFARVCHILSQ